MKISVNLSMLQFQQSDLVDTVREVLEETGVSASSLILEITESTMMNDPEFAIQTIKRLRDLGVCISLDDFGVGYSSFHYLKQLPVNKLKIDRSFVNDIVENEKDLSIVHALIIMAHQLGLAVVAEGVEREDQLTLLVQGRCDYVQGFYFDRPMSAGRFESEYLAPEFISRL